MALTDLSDGDFQYYKRKAHAMRNCHEKEFLQVIDPDLVRAMYRGRSSKYDYHNDIRSQWNDKSHFMAMSKIFQATNTILPNLYYQNPSPLALPRRGSDANSAALMTAILKYYMKLNDAKKQNQTAVMNSLFFGLGWKKIGYRTVFLPKVNEPESTLDQGVMAKIQGMMGLKTTPMDNTASKIRPDVVDYETLFNDSEDPTNIAIDDKADLDNSKAFLHMLPRTLHELQISGDFDEQMMADLEAKMRHKNGSRFDSREIDLHLNELHIMQRNGVWILSWVDEFEKPLKYDKSGFGGKGFLFSPLVLTNEPGCRYPISHIKVATQGQIKLNDLASMYVEMVARATNMLGINEKALSPGQMAALEQNLIRGILKFKGPIQPGDVSAFASQGVSNDIPNLMNVIQQNLTEIMGADPQLVAGNSNNDTLGQDELARVGTKVRESGMIDRVQDWMKDQLTKEGQLIKQYSNTELHLMITGKDYADRVTGQRIEDQWVEFMTERHPIGAKQYLQGEFDYDVNIYEAMKPDKAKIQKECVDAVTLFSNPVVQEAMLENNSRPRIDLLAEKAAENFEFLNGDEFVERLDPYQVAAIQAKKVIMQGGGQIPGSITPKDMLSAQTKQKPKEEKAVSNESSMAAKL